MSKRKYLSIPSPGNEDDINRSASKQLREIRTARGLLLEEVAELSNGYFSKSWLSNFERGAASVSFSRICILASIYDMSLEEMVKVFLGERYVDKYIKIINREEQDK